MTQLLQASSALTVYNHVLFCLLKYIALNNSCICILSSRCLILQQTLLGEISNFPHILLPTGALNCGHSHGTPNYANSIWEARITLGVNTHRNRNKAEGTDRWRSQNRNQVLMGSEQTAVSGKRVSFVITDAERWIITPVDKKHCSITSLWNIVQPLKIGRGQLLKWQ